MMDAKLMRLMYEAAEREEGSQAESEIKEMVESGDYEPGLPLSAPVVAVHHAMVRRRKDLALAAIEFAEAKEKLARMDRLCDRAHDAWKAAIQKEHGLGDSAMWTVVGVAEPQLFLMNAEGAKRKRQEIDGRKDAAVSILGLGDIPDDVRRALVDALTGAGDADDDDHPALH